MWYNDGVMKKIVCIRHGQSTWNAENKFTGWTNVDLSERGIAEAKEAGEILKKEGFVFDEAYTSFLLRAQHTLDIALETLGQKNIPITKTWVLNERHYGDLQGKNKKQIADEVGEDQFMIWRRSFDVPPPALATDDPRHPAHDPLYADVPADLLPGTESLKEVIERVSPYWEEVLKPRVHEGKMILISAHGNTIRALRKMLENITPEEIVELNIPYATPLVFEFDDDMQPLRSYYLGDQEKIDAVAKEVASQGKV
jgi:2,3-bisphosphoglycerate-dependent phosphoglycerate mutase